MHNYAPLHKQDLAEDDDVDLQNNAGNDILRERSWTSWIRAAVEVLLLLVVIGLSLELSLRAPHRPRGANEPMRNFGFTDTVFMNDSRFANAESFHDEDKLRETLRNWVELSSKGRGYVGIPNSERMSLESPPYDINPLHRPFTKEAYMISGFHQLHCLSTIMHSYARLQMGYSESEIGEHIAHCFDYLRQGILCAGDVTLEGNNSARLGVEIPWGTIHRCIDWDAARKWADERTVIPFPPGVDIL